MKIEDMEDSLLNKIKFFISNEKKLTDIVLKSSFYNAKKEAFEKIKDNKFIEKIAINLDEPFYHKIRYKAILKVKDKNILKKILSLYSERHTFEFEEIAILRHCIHATDEENIITDLLSNDRIFCILWHEDFMNMFIDGILKIKTRKNIIKIINIIEKECRDFQNDVFANSVLNGLLVKTKERLEELSSSLDFLVNNK